MPEDCSDGPPFPRKKYSRCNFSAILCASVNRSQFYHKTIRTKISFVYVKLRNKTTESSKFYPYKFIINSFYCPLVVITVVLLYRSTLSKRVSSKSDGWGLPPNITVLSSLEFFYVSRNTTYSRYVVTKIIAYNINIFSINKNLE